MVEEGEQDATSKSAVQVADESYLREEGSSKADNLTMISCSDEEKLDDEVSNNSVIDRLLYRYIVNLLGCTDSFLHYPKLFLHLLDKLY